MTHAAATDEEARAVGVPPGYRYYLGRTRRFAPPFDTSGVAYGFLAASIEDVSHYLIAQLNAGRYGETQLLSPDGVARYAHRAGPRHRPARRLRYGWRRARCPAPTSGWSGTPGRSPTRSAHFVLVPDSDLAVVVFSNIYSLAMDAPLTAAAFNAVRILHGHDPVTASPDPVFGWALLGLAAVAGGLLAALAWSLARALPAGAAVRRAASGANVGRDGWPILSTTAVWIAGCAAVAAGVGWALPAAWDGAGLAQVLLFAPDIGHAIIAVIALAAALALVRVAVTAQALARRA